jgi:nitrite reductase/ring-hydroxylating ferredoxin subunit
LSGKFQNRELLLSAVQHRGNLLYLAGENDLLKTSIMSKHYKWYKIADTEADLPFSGEGLATVEAGGRTICISLFKDELFACAAKCPHAGGNLAGGYTDAMGNIVCPLHRYKFSLATGRNVSGEGYFLKTYPVEKRESGIFIGIEQSGMFGWLK